jgi:predicted N-acetyltransferase YhbS
LKKVHAMTIEIRPIKPGDAEACGRICHAAFHKISTDHSFPPDFPSPEAATGLIKMMIAHPEIYGVVAEADGRIAGSNFLWEQSQVAGVGPITVDPQAQNGQIGRRLMDGVLARSAEKGWPSTRLVQAAYHNRSLSLYTKLGFDPCEPLSTIQGPPLNQRIAGYAVRAATAQDIDACNRVCHSVHGHDRVGEVRDAIGRGFATVVEHDGAITGYATVIGFFGHAVGATNTELKALIAAAPAIAGVGMLVPTRNADLLRWCLAHGLRIVQPMTLMSRGLYNEPKGAFLPSILF